MGDGYSIHPTVFAMALLLGYAGKHARSFDFVQWTISDNSSKKIHKSVDSFRQFCHTAPDWQSHSVA